MNVTDGTNGRETTLYTSRSREKGEAAQAYTYDSRGRITGLADGNQNHTSYESDHWGRICQVEGADGGREGYTYDYAGHITSTIDASGGVITYRYNSQGKVCEIIDQEGNSETFRYDREGRRTLHTDRNGNQIKTTYSIDSNRVLEIGCDKEEKDRETRSWEYDSRGQLRKAAAGGGVYTYEYRPDGKLLKKAASGRTLVSCAYFEDGSLKSLRDESGRTVDYGYDWKGQLASITDEKGERIVQYHHFPDGKLKEVIHGNGVKTFYEYDTDGNISRLTTLLSEKDLLCDFQYDYDLNGNRTAKAGACLFPGETSMKDTVIRYQYDSMNRLLEEEYDGEAIRYRYDLCGNRLEKESVAERETYGYNRRNQVTERVTPQGRVLFDYDLQGNLVEKSGAERERYCYNPFNQQTKIEGPDGFAQTYLYDGEGLRAGTTTKKGSSRFVFYNGELLTETKDEEAFPSRYILGYGVAASEVAGYNGYHAYHLNAQNSTAYITGSQRQVENAYAYDSFGNLRGQAGELQNRILYTGQQYNLETGQYYLRARYYNPVVGRFTQEDVYRGDGLNLYAYCKNNPVTYYDPSGFAYSLSEVLSALSTDSNGNKYVLNHDHDTAIKYGYTSSDDFSGVLQSHHGLQQKWATSNLSDYGYNSDLVPTITLETNANGVKNLPHTLITNQQNAYNRENGSTSGTLQERLILGAQQELNAGISKDVVMQDLENNYKMIDKLNDNNVDKITSGELEKLTYSKEEVESSLEECNGESEKCP